MSEMLNIQLQNNALNYQIDTEYLQNTYINFKQNINMKV